MFSCTFANWSFRCLVSPANTNGGKVFIFPELKSSTNFARCDLERDPEMVPNLIPCFFSSFSMGFTPNSIQCVNIKLFWDFINLFDRFGKL